MDCSMPCFSVPHHLPKLAQVHVHCIGDAIQPSHPLTPFLSFCPQFFSAWGTVPLSQLFISDDQNTGVSGSASVQQVFTGDFPLKLTGLISLLSTGLSGVFSSTTVWRHQFFSTPLLYTVQCSQPYVTIGKTIDLTIRTFAGRVMSLLFKTLSRFVIAFLPRSKGLLISQLQSPSTGILEPKKRKSVTTSTFSPSICHEVMGPDAMIWGFPGSDGKEFACNSEDLGSIPGLQISPGRRYGNPLQYSCLENPHDRGAWWATVYRVTKS